MFRPITDQCVPIEQKLNALHVLMRRIENCGNRLSSLAVIVPHLVETLNKINDEDFWDNPGLVFTVGEDLKRIKALNKLLINNYPGYKDHCPHVYEHPHTPSPPNSPCGDGRGYSPDEVDEITQSWLDY